MIESDRWVVLIKQVMVSILLCVMAVCVMGCERESEPESSVAADTAVMTVEPQLTVKPVEIEHHSLEKMISIYANDIDIIFRGQATRADIHIQVYKDGVVSYPMQRIGGYAQFPAVDQLRLFQRIMLIDSENSPFVLNEKNIKELPCYRILATTEYLWESPSEPGKWHTGSSTGPGPFSIPKSAISFAQGSYAGVFDEFDLSQEFIPIAFIRNNAGGSMDKPMKNGKLDLTGDPGIGFVIFYLSLHDK